MADWDHRAPTGNGAYQLYLYVVEIQHIRGGGYGQVNLNWEIGIIKVGSSGGFGSSDGAVEWEVHMHGYNNGDASGTAGFSAAAGAAIGTRWMLANGSTPSGYWSFSYNPNSSGTLSLNTMARATFANSIGSPQVGWGSVAMSNVAFQGSTGSNPLLQNRISDTSWTMRAYNGVDWGVGSGAVEHSLDWSTASNMAGAVGIAFPTTGSNAAHDIAFSPAAHTTYYFRSNSNDRPGYNNYSGIVAVYGRPSLPNAPELGSKTTTTLNLTTAAPTYVGAAITARETELWNAADSSLLQTSTHVTAPSFTGLTRVTTYKARTRVQNSTGWSDWSAWYTVSTPGTPPTAPTGYTVFDIAATSAKVTTGSIADNGGAVPTQVRVKVSTTASDVGLVQTVTQTSWNPVRLSGLNEGTVYYVAEAAFITAEGGGWGPYGAWVSFTTSNIVPNAPALSIGSISATNATATWVAPTDLNGAVIANYKLRVSSDQAQLLNVQEFTIPAGTLSQVITGLVGSTGYYASVWTETDKGLGSSSPLVSFTTTGGGGSTSGIWMSGADGIPKFSGVWFSGADGIPKLCEVWYSGADGIPKLCVS